MGYRCILRSNNVSTRPKKTQIIRPLGKDRGPALTTRPWLTRNLDMAPVPTCYEDPGSPADATSSRHLRHPKRIKRPSNPTTPTCNLQGISGSHDYHNCGAAPACFPAGLLPAKAKASTGVLLEWRRDNNTGAGPNPHSPASTNNTSPDPSSSRQLLSLLRSSFLIMNGE